MTFFSFVDWRVVCVASMGIGLFKCGGALAAEKLTAVSIECPIENHSVLEYVAASSVKRAAVRYRYDGQSLLEISLFISDNGGPLVRKALLQLDRPMGAPETDMASILSNIASSLMKYVCNPLGGDGTPERKKELFDIWLGLVAQNGGGAPQ